MSCYVELILFVAAATGLLYYFLTKNFNYWKDRGVEFEKAVPILGSMLPVVRGKISFGQYFEFLYQKFEGPYFGIYGLPHPILVLRDPDIINRVLIKDFNKFPNNVLGADEKVDSMMYNTLLAAKNTRWKALRTKLSPLFTSGKMKLMFPLMKECGEDLQNYIMKILNTTTEMKELSVKYTTDVITSCAFGVKAHSFDSEDSEFKVMGNRLVDFTLYRSLSTTAYFFAPSFVKLFKLKFIDGIAARFMRNMFWDTVNTRESKQIKRNDLIDLLIKLRDEESQTNEEFKFDGDVLVAQAVIFFVGGQESTSTALSFALYELCVNPEIQTKLRTEIETVIAKHGELTYDSIVDMKYLQMVISETLRKYSVTPILNRVSIEDYKIPETGLIIEKGTPVFISQYGLHHDPKYFPNPENFDPERFNDQNKHNIPSGVYIPFGDGPRNCIGERFALMSVKVALIHILRKFEVVKCEETPIPVVFKVRAPLLQSTVGLPMKIKKL